MRRKGKPARSAAAPNHHCERHRPMRGNGITYDTGFFNAGVSTHEPFDPQVVKREMRVIHDDLHCNAVRITGVNADRLEIAAIHAADTSFEGLFSPFTCDLSTDELLDFLADCAERAERLRRQGAEVVFVTGAELSLFTVGFLPSATLKDRLDLLAAPPRLRELLPQVPPRINDFLGKDAARVRERFGGKISYASIPFEGVDWALFDFISVDAHRSIAVADPYRESLRALVAQGKPVAITEFGCATFQGAADKGASGGGVFQYRHQPPIPLGGAHHPHPAQPGTYPRD